MIKKTIFFLVPFCALLILFYVYTGTNNPVVPTPTPTTTDTQPGQSSGISSPAHYEKKYEHSKQTAAEATDPHLEAVALLDAASYLKKFSIDVDAIVAEYVPIYQNETFSDAERGLALFKVSQQANGNNRYDVLNQFLSPEEQTRSDREKNYLINKKIFALTPLSLVYADIKLYEVKNGAEFYADDLYYDVRNRVESDVAQFESMSWLQSLIPDTIMHAATLYAQIDEHSAENGIADDIVLQTYERALELNKLHTQNNPTKDYIALETINYLLKIGSTEEAQKRTQAFLSGTPTNMIKSFISNGGLTNGRFEHIASNPELSNTIITTLSNT